MRMQGGTPCLAAPGVPLSQLLVGGGMSAHHQHGQVHGTRFPKPLHITHYLADVCILEQLLC